MKFTLRMDPYKMFMPPSKKKGEFYGLVAAPRMLLLLLLCVLHKALTFVSVRLLDIAFYTIFSTGVNYSMTPLLPRAPRGWLPWQKRIASSKRWNCEIEGGRSAEAIYFIFFWLNIGPCHTKMSFHEVFFRCCCPCHTHLSLFLPKMLRIFIPWLGVPFDEKIKPL